VVKRSATLVLLAGLLVPTEGGAQEIHLTGPLAGACILRLDRYAVPAQLEWAFWTGGGVAIDEGVQPMASAGAEATTGLVEYEGFPARTYAHRLDPDRPQDRTGLAELRMGPWFQGTYGGPGEALAELGLTMHAGTVGKLEPWGELDLRIGAGYASRDAIGAPHVALALGWGYRWVFDRQTFGGACDRSPDPEPLADATLARVVTTVRRTFEAPRWEFTLALEFTPTVALIAKRHEQRRYRLR